MKYNRKLTEDDVRLIRALKRSSMEEIKQRRAEIQTKKDDLAKLVQSTSFRSIGEKFGVHRRTIQRIYYGTLWAGVKG